MRIHVLQEHIDAAPIGSGTNPVNLALQKQLGEYWRWLGGNQIRERRAIYQPQPDLGIVRIPPLADGRQLHNAMSGWFRGELEPFSFEVPIEGEDMPKYGVKYDLVVEMAVPLTVAPVAGTGLTFLEPGTETFELQVTNDSSPAKDVNLRVTASALGPHADKFVMPPPQDVSIVAGAQATLQFPIELTQAFPTAEPVSIRIRGKEI
jgi:hypothetical protein